MKKTPSNSIRCVSPTKTTGHFFRSLHRVTQLGVARPRPFNLGSWSNIWTNSMKTTKMQARPAETRDRCETTLGSQGGWNMVKCEILQDARVYIYHMLGSMILLMVHWLSQWRFTGWKNFWGFLIFSGQNKVLNVYFMALGLSKFRNPAIHQLIWRIYHYLQGFTYLSWLFGISSINILIWRIGTHLVRS